MCLCLNERRSTLQGIKYSLKSQLDTELIPGKSKDQQSHKPARRKTEKKGEETNKREWGNLENIININSSLIRANSITNKYRATGQLLHF